MDKPTDADFTALPIDKALAIGTYGEAVAAYRYLVLSEKALSEEDRRILAELADEEQDHKLRLRDLLTKLFPESAFVLTDRDKEMVVVGPRLLDVHDAESFADAMRMLLFSERKTAKFYAKLGKYIDQDKLRALFRELAEEDVGHCERLKQLAEKDGIPSDER